MIVQEVCPVVEVHKPGDGTYALAFRSRSIARSVKAGQFLNVRVDGTTDPLLRRPFSVYRAEGDFVELIFHVIGKGTALLAAKRKGDAIDVLGPLGTPFKLTEGDFATAILVGGGLGVAPLPIATATLRAARTPVATFLGARSSNQVVDAYLDNLSVATDDGTRGFNGNVVELLRTSLVRNPYPNPKIFACGPTAMLKALATFAIESNIPCEVSLEGPMACGIGICQGCPVELTGDTKKYALMCKDGPVFDVRTIRL
jgi:dihydroorotate dehydrogenase electron transfer subunit